MKRENTNNVFTSKFTNNLPYFLSQQHKIGTVESKFSVPILCVSKKKQHMQVRRPLVTHFSKIFLS